MSASCVAQVSSLTARVQLLTFNRFRTTADIIHRPYRTKGPPSVSRWAKRWSCPPSFFPRWATAHLAPWNPPPLTSLNSTGRSARQRRTARKTGHCKCSGQPPVGASVRAAFGEAPRSQCSPPGEAHCRRSRTVQTSAHSVHPRATPPAPPHPNYPRLVNATTHSS